MIIGIGTDIARIERFQRFIDEDNHALLRRIFTEGERAECSRRKNSAASYAARFAAKEAMLKALGTGLRDGLSWQDMEIINNPLGKPEMYLNGATQQMTREKGITNIFLSLSHDGGNAIAMLVLESL